MSNTLKISGQRFQVLAKGDAPKVVDVWIYDVIGDFLGQGVSSKRMADELKPHADAETINVYINSPGGIVFEAHAMYNTLARHQAEVNVYIDGMALSAASVLAMAGDRIHMAENAMLMIHDPWSCTCGSADEMLKTAEALEKIKSSIVDTYAARTGMDADEIARLMGEETWMTAAEAMELGFVTQIDAAKRAAALAVPHKTLSLAYKHPPERLDELLKPAASGGTVPPPTDTVKQEKGPHMPDPKQNVGGEKQPQAAETPDRKTEGKAFQDAFGEDLGSKYFAQGLSMDEARQRFSDHLQSQVKDLTEQNADLQKRLDAARDGMGTQPAAFDGADTGDHEGDNELAKLVELFDGDEARAKRIYALRRSKRSA